MRINHRISRATKEDNESQDYKAFKKALNSLTIVVVTVMVCTTAVVVSDNLNKK